MNFKKAYPYMMPYWNSKKNNEKNIFPEEITYGSSVDVYFICKEGHEFVRKPRSLKDKKSEKVFCKVCTGQEFIEDVKLDDNYPEVAAEWDYVKNNTTPDKVSYLSNKKYWWRCEHNHSWEAGISNRTGHRYKDKDGSRCPYCWQSSVSRNELIIFSELHQFFENVYSSHKLHDKNLDIYIEDINLCVEYDGENWHKLKLSSDKERNDLLRENKIETLRVRELPLPKIEEYDIEYDIKEDLFFAIKEIFLFILKNKKLNKNIKKEIENYIKNGKATNTSFFKKIEDKYRIKKIKNDILFKDYNKEKNKLALHYYGQGSEYNAHWKCYKCGHEYRKSVKKKNEHPNCIKCTPKKIVSGYNQKPRLSKNPFSKTQPEIRAMWSIKNEDNPDYYGQNYSNKKFIWNCNFCNKEFKKEIRQMVRTNATCSHCYKYNIGEFKGDNIGSHRGNHKK